MFKFKDFRKVYRNTPDGVLEYMKSNEHTDDVILENRNFIYTKNPNLNSTENKIIEDAMSIVNSAFLWLESFHNGEYYEILSMLDKCDVIFTSPYNEEIKTMGVSAPKHNPMGSNRFTLWINPMFVLEQNTKPVLIPGKKQIYLPINRAVRRIAWVLAHEMLHISQNHHMITDIFNHVPTIANVAEDYWINLGLSQLPHCEKVEPQEDENGNPIYLDSQKLFRYYTITGLPPSGDKDDLGFLFPVSKENNKNGFPNAITALLDDKYLLQRRLSGNVREIMDAVDIYDEIQDRFSNDEDGGEPGGGEGGEPGGGEGGEPGGGEGGEPKPGKPGPDGGGYPVPGGSGGKYTEKDIRDKFNDLKPDYKPDNDELRKSTPIRKGGDIPGSFDPKDNFTDLEFEGAPPGSVGDIVKTRDGFGKIISKDNDGVDVQPISAEEVASVFNNFK